MSQRGLILRLLREAGPTGVDTHELIYVYGITQPAARINELRTNDPFYDIETIDRGMAPDGRRRLCTYVLKGAEGRVRSVPPSPVAPAVPLPLPCGCVRSATGMGWDSRCDAHAEAQLEREEAQGVPW